MIIIYLSPNQHGFRPGLLCETQLTSTIHDWSSWLDCGIPTDVAIFDFCKAFDLVPHKRLLYKLDHYDIRGNLFKMVQFVPTQS